MKQWIRIGTLALCAAMGVLHAAGDAANGERLFAQCKACHTVEQGKHKTGPSLSGVLGRTAGKAQGFAYSPALAGSHFAWSEEQLDKWLADSKSLVAGSKMNFRLSAPATRADVIAYLKTLR